MFSMFSFLILLSFAYFHIEIPSLLLTLSFKRYISILSSCRLHENNKVISKVVVKRFFIILVKLAANVLALGEEADFEALNCQPNTKVDTRQNVQLTTEPAFLPNAC
jgi:hypothetical protein